MILYGTYTEKSLAPTNKVHDGSCKIMKALYLLTVQFDVPQIKADGGINYPHGIYMAQ